VERKGGGDRGYGGGFIGAAWRLIGKELKGRVNPAGEVCAGVTAGGGRRC
jgi:hypothetical protein